MALDNFIPEIWSARLLYNMHKAQVYAQPSVINREYEGDIREAGDVVRITAIGAVAISAYTKNTNMSAPETLDDAQTLLQINQAKYFNFQVDDVDKVQQRPKVMEAAMAEAAYALSDDLDAAIAALYTDVASGNLVGSSGSPKTDLGTVGKPYTYLLELGECLSEANVPKTGRWVIVPPWYVTELMQDTKIVNPGTAQAENRLANAWIARLAGFDVYESNNVSNDGTTWRIIAGVPMAWTVASQIMNMEAYRPELRFADAVKGLHLYGIKVVRPTGLACLYGNQPT